jgi:hypothetical protein
MFDLAIILYTLRRFGSPALTCWVAFAAFGPGLIASPFAGALLDRLRAPLAIIVDMLITAGLLLALICSRSTASLPRTAQWNSGRIQKM